MIRKISYIGSMFLSLLSSCTSLPSENNLSWNLPLYNVLTISDLLTTETGIAYVDVLATYDGSENICVLKPVIEGGPSNHVYADLIDIDGSRIETGVNEVGFYEALTPLPPVPRDFVPLQTGKSYKWRLNYNGLYSGIGVVGKGYKFRALMDAEICENIDANIYAPIILSSQFVRIDTKPSD